MSFVLTKLALLFKKEISTRSFVSARVDYSELTYLDKPDRPCLGEKVLVSSRERKSDFLRCVHPKCVPVLQFKVCCCSKPRCITRYVTGKVPCFNHGRMNRSHPCSGGDLVEMNRVRQHLTENGEGYVSSKSLSLKKKTKVSVCTTTTCN